VSPHGCLLGAGFGNMPEGCVYPDGGGLTSAARAKREQVRLKVAGLFAAGMSPPQVAKKLRIFRKSACVWRETRARALESKGPGGQRCRLSQARCSGWRTPWTLTRPAPAENYVHARQADHASHPGSAANHPACGRK
jgi:hypothetical protein